MNRKAYILLGAELYVLEQRSR